MAIQVSGTQVIGNSRELTNIASVDATTAASITAAGVGGGLPSFSPGNTPDATFTSSGTWTKPGSIGASDFVTFFLVGGGGGAGAGSWAGGGSGGNGCVFTARGDALPATLSITIGAAGAGSTGGAGGNAGATSVTISSQVFSASGGLGASSSSSRQTADDAFFGLIPNGSFPFSAPTKADGRGGKTDTLAAGSSSVYGGGGGGSTSTNQVAAPGIKAGGTSTYSGNGGASANNTNGTAGSLPGGGGGGSQSTGANGGSGSVRIYYG